MDTLDNLVKDIWGLIGYFEIKMFADSDYEEGRFDMQQQAASDLREILRYRGFTKE